MDKNKIDIRGLSTAEVEEKLLTYGRNEIGTSQTSWFSLLLRQFTSPFFYLLLLACIVSFLLGERLDSLMIIVFVGINTCLGFFQEYRSEKTVALLRKFITSKVRVRRDGKESLIESYNLVLGDIVFFEPGDIVSADVQILDSYDLTINESVLTGESEPISKSATSEKESERLLFSGTEISSGKATCIVIATGKNTQYGYIAKLAVTTKKESSFEKQLARLSTFILILVIVTLVFVVAINFFVKKDFQGIEFLLFAIALCVSVIPEALPVVTTFSLSIGAKHLAKKSVVVKRLSAIEDLGSIEILCSDKTGTLTENVLEVVGTNTKDPAQLFLYASLASTYVPTSRNAGNNAFEVAIANELAHHPHAKLSSFKKIHEIPFDPTRRRATALFQHGSLNTLISRGGPEAILSLCDLSKREKKEAMDWVIERGKLGIRTLAIASKRLHVKNKNAKFELQKEENNMELVGFIAFKDPIKPSTFSALQKAKELGVQVKILTGDSVEVACAVAKDIGLIDSFDQVIHGDTFDHMNTKEQHEAVFSCHVFARVTPVQKYKIIELLKEKNEVGFLGEGINDAPALKISNVGMVVESASDVAREASDIVLLDRSLSVIIDGIHEGRAVFANTSKYITTTLSANFGNFFAVAIVSLMVDYLPMLPLQILLVNLLSDFPMISVATDTVDAAEVTGPKKYDLKSFALLSLVLGLTSTFFDFIFFASFKNSGVPTLQTTWFIGSILTELVFIFSARSRKFFLRSKFPSWTLIVLAIVAAEITIFIPYTKIGHDIFKFVTPSFTQIITVLGIVVLYFMTTESVKLLYYKFATKNATH